MPGPGRPSLPPRALAAGGRLAPPPTPHAHSGRSSAHLLRQTRPTGLDGEEPVHELRRQRPATGVVAGHSGGPSGWPHRKLGWPHWEGPPAIRPAYRHVASVGMWDWGSQCAESACIAVSSIIAGPDILTERSAARFSLCPKPSSIVPRPIVTQMGRCPQSGAESSCPSPS